MGTTLHSLSPNPGATKRAKRVGRGRASGNGKTSGRGMKGQKARAGHHGATPGYEGGQMPMIKRLPKRGFKNLFRTEAHAVNVGFLGRFDSTVDVDALRSAGLIPKSAKIVKILGDGALDKPLTIKAHRFSKSALEKIAAAGGTALVIPARKSGTKVDSEA